MSAFLYFVAEHDDPVTAALLEQWGLAYAFDEVPFHSVMTGPAGSGTLLCDQTLLEPMVPKYLPSEQTWRQVPAQLSGNANLYVGYYHEARPTRDDLARPVLLPGPTVTLADDQAWQVPLVRQVSAEGTSECTLPCYLDLDEAGETIRGEVLERYRWLWDRVEPFWTAYLREVTAALNRVAELSPQATDAERERAGQFHIPCPTLRDDALAVLAANYRLGLVEATLLQLFRSDEGFGPILKAACNTAQAALVLQKKTASPTTT